MGRLPVSIPQGEKCARRAPAGGSETEIHAKVPRVSDDPLPFVSRLFLAHVAWARILTDGSYARKVAGLDEAPKALPAKTEVPPPAPAPAEPVVAPPPSARASAKSAPADMVDTKPDTPERISRANEATEGSALSLLARLQSEGRLIDFLEDDVKPYSDAEVGAAARVVHEGCRRALREALPVVALRDEAEGSSVVLLDGFDKDVYKLTGNVAGSAPFRGTLRHRGWKVSEVKLGARISGNPHIIAPAEVEL